MSDQIKVPDYVVETMEEVRVEGRFNMFMEANGVVKRMSEINVDAAIWLIDEEKSRIHTDRYLSTLDALARRYR